MVKGHTHAVQERFMFMQSATGRATPWNGRRFGVRRVRLLQVSGDSDRSRYEYTAGLPPISRLVRSGEGSPAGTAA